MDKKNEWHKLESIRGKKGKRKEAIESSKPPAHTDRPGGSRQGNAGMEEDTDDARR